MPGIKDISREVNTPKLVGQTSNLSIDDRFVGWMTQFGTKYWASQGKDYAQMTHDYYDYSPLTGGQRDNLFTYSVSAVVGDINDNGHGGFEDALLALQVLSGLNP